MTQAITPGELIMRHFFNGKKPVLKVGDRFQWDDIYVSEHIPSLELYKNALNHYYKYKLVFGSEDGIGLRIYEVTEVKSN
ncbi:hypothetical protein DBR40_05325 [Pedobacter sp. KBW01]|uniref:hypothetical protein n=1 Tax=Pedobacter sp. KBW01 TaxID=2153364 RepID=UPI000F5AD6FD|nr:hypothetical protein [Pedobacter sp. KBW01]RQO79142.1 hypothetical protein DBR40_05325 [Pedobacter sp. KBW01]